MSPRALSPRTNSPRMTFLPPVLYAPEHDDGDDGWGSMPVVYPAEPGAPNAVPVWITTQPPASGDAPAMAMASPLTGLARPANAPWFR